VPSQYRYQYRDGNGVYYRSDGRAIYQIDARTDTVLRVYSMDR
jgi:nuclear transport factor 2 (NTF2) superfamily protein